MDGKPRDGHFDLFFLDVKLLTTKYGPDPNFFDYNIQTPQPQIKLINS